MGIKFSESFRVTDLNELAALTDIVPGSRYLVLYPGVGLGPDEYVYVSGASYATLPPLIISGVGGQWIKRNLFHHATTTPTTPPPFAGIIWLAVLSSPARKLLYLSTPTEWVLMPTPVAANAAPTLPGDYVGQLYTAIADAIQYFWDGSSWIPFSSASSGGGSSPLDTLLAEIEGAINDSGGDGLNDASVWVADTWDDASSSIVNQGNLGGNAISPSATETPTATDDPIIGRKALSFDGNDDVLRVGAASGYDNQDDWTVFMVFKPVNNWDMAGLFNLAYELNNSGYVSSYCLKLTHYGYNDPNDLSYWEADTSIDVTGFYAPDPIDPSYVMETSTGNIASNLYSPYEPVIDQWQVWTARRSLSGYLLRTNQADLMSGDWGGESMVSVPATHVGWTLGGTEEYNLDGSVSTHDYFSANSYACWIAVRRAMPATAIDRIENALKAYYSLP